MNDLSWNGIFREKDVQVTGPISIFTPLVSATHTSVDCGSVGLKSDKESCLPIDFEDRQSSRHQ